MAFRTEEKELVCGACGETSLQTVVAEFDPDESVPDLDMRPDEPHRSYIKYWVMECPHCGYCNASIDIPAEFTKEYPMSERYRKPGDDLAGRFIKMSLSCEKNKVYNEAVKAALYAAWVCDDENDEKRAAECRRAALKIYDSHKAVLSEDQNIVLLAADLMRRSGDFERVKKEYKGKYFPSTLYRLIAAYQMGLAEKGDSSCHKADEIPGIAVK